MDFLVRARGRRRRLEQLFALGALDVQHVFIYVK